jgi:hypothetical protein
VYETTKILEDNVRNINKLIKKGTIPLLPYYKKVHHIKGCNSLRGCTVYTLSIPRHCWASPYRVGDIDLAMFKDKDVDKYKRTENRGVNELKLIKGVFRKNGISTVGKKLPSHKKITCVFNELIHIPNFVQLITDNKGLLDVEEGVADADAIDNNKHKMLELYPFALQKSQMCNKCPLYH